MSLLCGAAQEVFPWPKKVRRGGIAQIAVIYFRIIRRKIAFTYAAGKFFQIFCGIFC